MTPGGLLPNQLKPYWSPDGECTVDPLKSAATAQEIRRFMEWLEGFCVDMEALDA